MEVKGSLQCSKLCTYRREVLPFLRGRILKPLLWAATALHISFFVGYLGGITCSGARAWQIFVISECISSEARRSLREREREC